MKYKVRGEFYVHFEGQVFEPGAEVDLTDEQAMLYAHQIEPAEAPKTSRKCSTNSVWVRPR